MVGYRIPTIQFVRFLLLSTHRDGTITTYDSNDCTSQSSTKFILTFHILIKSPVLTDNYGFGKDKRRLGNLEILAGRDTFRWAFFKLDVWPCINFLFRDGFRQMLDSVVANGHTFDECKEILQNSAWFYLCQLNVPDLEIDIKLDLGFKEFYIWCKSNDIPVIIVSR